MYYMKGWLRCLKPFEPSVISLSGHDSLYRKVSTISEDTTFRENIIYIGKLSETAYRFRSLIGITLFLINDTNYILEKLNCGDNTVIVFPADTSKDELYATCTSFIAVQDRMIENRHKLLDYYVEDGSFQGLLDTVSAIIDDPVMVIDNSFRLIGYSEVDECPDLVWMDSIKNGYCSYEFVSQFNKLNEIGDIKKGDAPVLAGCLMSPMRRCIVTLFADRKPVGYLLSIESGRPFDSVTIENLEQASKLIAREVVRSAEAAGLNPYHSSWDAVVDALEGKPKSGKILREFLQSEGLRADSDYYILLMRFDDDADKSNERMPLYSVFKSVFPRSVLSYYKSDVLAIVDFDEGLEKLHEKITAKSDYIREKHFSVAVSDSFRDLESFGRYYQQARRVQDLKTGLNIRAPYCMYDSVRIYDMILNKIEPEEVPLFLRDKERALVEYDLENGTEYFKTLYSYIRHSRSLGDVSAELHIHKNSVSYRINRIKELFDIDLNDAETRIGFYLAYHVLELKNLKKEA